MTLLRAGNNTTLASRVSKQLKKEKGGWIFCQEEIHLCLLEYWLEVEGYRWGEGRRGKDSSSKIVETLDLAITVSEKQVPPAG